MFVEWAPFLIVGLVALAVAAGLGAGQRFRVIGSLLVAGVVMRILGSLARHYMVFGLYEGGGDSAAYLEAGQVIAEHFRSLDFSIIGSGYWGEKEWGTQVIRYITGLVTTFIGPTVRGAFLVFSLAAFAGLVCTVVAFARSSNAFGSMRHAAVLLFFWPTLWFWPSSVGKEAILLLAIGLVTLGYVGMSDRIRWVPLAAGLLLAMVIRPHVAGVLAISLCIAEWTSRGLTGPRLAQTVLTSAFAMFLLVNSLSLLGLENADMGTIEGFVQDTAARTRQGGSAFEQSSGSLVESIPMAFVNMLCRPFITEATSPMALASSLEMMALWGLMLRNRRSLWSVLRDWRTNRIARFAIPFTLLYIVMIGVTFQNFGIIARQRALAMPLLLLTFVAVPSVRMRVPQSSAVQPRLRRTWNTAPAPLPQANRSV